MSLTESHTPIVNNAIGVGKPDIAIGDRSVDRAVPSDKKTGPHRLLITLSFDVVGCLIALYPRLPGTSLEAPGHTPESAAKLQEVEIVVGQHR
jgi:hypothetical protein